MVGVRQVLTEEPFLIFRCGMNAFLQVITVSTHQRIAEVLGVLLAGLSFFILLFLFHKDNCRAKSNTCCDHGNDQKCPPGKFVLLRSIRRCRWSLCFGCATLCADGRLLRRHCWRGRLRWRYRRLRWRYRRLRRFLRLCRFLRLGWFGLFFHNGHGYHTAVCHSAVRRFHHTYVVSSSHLGCVAEQIVGGFRSTVHRADILQLSRIRFIPQEG